MALHHDLKVNNTNNYADNISECIYNAYASQT